jgi:hypothetical protein
MPLSGPLTRLLLIPSDASETQFTTEVQGTVIWATILQPYENEDFRTRLGIPMMNSSFALLCRTPSAGKTTALSCMGRLRVPCPTLRRRRSCLYV